MKPSKGKQSAGTRTLKVDYLARVEGEGALFIRLKGTTVEALELQIFEPPRFFEAFLRGRRWTEAPDITARICGICPMAYISSAQMAMESIVDAALPRGIHQLRRLAYCGEWIESHVLHVAMLHAPDFLGFQDAIEMARQYPDVVKNALRLKKLGNEIMAVIGGREIHPINFRVGGFYRLPERAALEALLPELEWGIEAAAELTRLTAGFTFPSLERDYEFVALRHPEEYAMIGGRLISNKGLDIPLSAFYEHIEEIHVPRSTSLHSKIKGRGAYLVGPLARYNLNFCQLTPRCQQLAEEVGLLPPVRNPFKSIVVRCMETLYAVEEAIRLIRDYEPPAAPYVPLEPRAGRGHGCSEAPRGICYHTYEIDDQGVIRSARIAPPTAQNQSTIEEDLWDFVPRHAALSDDELIWKCEQAVRNYDPCISCSCHFLRGRIERLPAEGS
jgi:coenzyme F420-reducing hydrogenase alpha subunit